MSTVKKSDFIAISQNIDGDPHSTFNTRMTILLQKNELLWLYNGLIDLMLVVATSAIYIHSARVAAARVTVLNIKEPDVEIGELNKKDWLFKGSASAVIPEVLEDVPGLVPMTKN
ncbi:MAG: hypothetical protein Q9225_001461 [Loekoesia sp. 1 TL-2023]